MSPGDAEDQIRRGVEASQLMANPLLSQALDAIRADLFDKIERTTWRQKSAREAIYQQLVACNNFESQLKYHIENGKLARSWLEQWKATQAVKRSRRKA